MKRALTEKQKQAQYRAAGRMYAAMAGVDPKPMDMEPISSARGNVHLPLSAGKEQSLPTHAADETTRRLKPKECANGCPPFQVCDYCQYGPSKRRTKKAAVRLPKESEADILKAIMRLLKHHPKVAKVWRQNSGTFALQYGPKTHYFRANTARGMSDIMGILKTGKMIALEVKSAKGRVSEHQEEFLQQIRDGGGIAAVVRSVDDVLEILKNA